MVRVIWVFEWNWPTKYEFERKTETINNAFAKKKRKRETNEQVNSDGKSGINQAVFDMLYEMFHCCWWLSSVNGHAHIAVNLMLMVNF